MRLFLSSYQNGLAADKLIELARGNLKTAVIMNAKDMIDPERRNFRNIEEMDRLKGIGLEPEEIDLRKFAGKKAALRRELGKFGIIWVTGGNVFVLQKAFRRSGLDTLVPEILDKDTHVYAGYSAGVCVLSKTLHGIELCDDISLGKVYFPEVDFTWDGLGVLPYSVAPHYKSNHYESKMIEQVVDYFKSRDMPYRTLRDGETIIIEGSI